MIKFTKNIFLLISLLISNQLFANSFILKNENYKNKEIKYYEYNSKKIIESTFNLKENQNTEIIYIFSYNCQTCYIINEYMNEFHKYIKTQENVRYEKIPYYSGKNEIDKYNAEIFITRKFFKFNESFDDKIFDMIHIDKKSVKNEIDKNKLFKEYLKLNSEELNSIKYNETVKYMLLRIKNIIKDIKTETTPTIIIHKNGKRYLINADIAGDPDTFLLTIFAILDKKSII